MKQPVHAKKSVLATKLFTVNELEVEIKPGVRRIHHNVERDPIVYVFPITADNYIYLTKQYRYNHERYVIEAVAGYIEKNEDPLVAAKRELKEETGLIAKTWHMLPQMEMGAGSFKGKVYLFVAKDLEEGETNFDESEEIETIKIPLEECVKKIENGEINLIMSVAGILLTYKLIREKKI